MDELCEYCGGRKDVRQREGLRMVSEKEFQRIKKSNKNVLEELKKIMKERKK